MVKSSGGWRVVFYMECGINVVAVVLGYLYYRPAAPLVLQTTTRRQILRDFDYVGLFGLAVGLNSLQIRFQNYMFMHRPGRPSPPSCGHHLVGRRVQVQFTPGPQHLCHRCSPHHCARCIWYVIPLIFWLTRYELIFGNQRVMSPRTRFSTQSYSNKFEPLLCCSWSHLQAACCQYIPSFTYQRFFDV